MEDALEPESLIGQQLGAYRLVRKLGAGGMGVVFEGVHAEIGQRVAIKLLHAHISRDGKTFRRFENEARAIGKIKHPGLVNIFGYEHNAAGVAYIVMEFLQGESLYDRIETLRREDKRMPGAQAVAIVRQVASTLTEAHAHGIVHCDLKPENVFLVRDELVEFGERAKVLDFGIAKFMSDDGGRKTTVGLILGTPIYMSPEQCEGRDQIGAKTDVYSLGVMLYELLAGEPPFRADGSAALMRKHMLAPPPPIVDKAPEVPAHIASLLMRMLEKEVNDRPTMKDLVGGLATFGPQSTRGGTLRSARWPQVVVLSIVMAAAVGAGLAFTLKSRSPASPAARRSAPVSSGSQGAQSSASPSATVVAPPPPGRAPSTQPAELTPVKAMPPSGLVATKKKRSGQGKGHVGASPVETQEPAKSDVPARAVEPPAAPTPAPDQAKDAAPAPRKRVYEPMR